MFETLKVLIIEWRKLPNKLKDEIREYDQFHNDTYIDLGSISEFYPKDYLKGMSTIEEYFEEQKLTNEYMSEQEKSSIENFIKSYGLEFDVWMIEQVENGKVDLSDVDKIMIEVCW